MLALSRHPEKKALNKKELSHFTLIIGENFIIDFVSTPKHVSSPQHKRHNDSGSDSTYSTIPNICHVNAINFHNDNRFSLFFWLLQSRLFSMKIDFFLHLPRCVLLNVKVSIVIVAVGGESLKFVNINFVLLPLSILISFRTKKTATAVRITN